MKKIIFDLKKNKRFRNLIKSRGMAVDEKEKIENTRRGGEEKKEGSIGEGERMRELFLSPHYFFIRLSL